MFSSRVTQGSGPAIDLVVILALSLLMVPLVALARALDIVCNSFFRLNLKILQRFL